MMYLSYCPTLSFILIGSQMGVERRTQFLEHFPCSIASSAPSGTATADSKSDEHCCRIHIGPDISGSSETEDDNACVDRPLTKLME